MNIVLGALFLLALIIGTLPPGRAAYPASYAVMAIGTIGLVSLGWSERSALRHPVALSILCAIALLSATVPLVYRSELDLMAPVFVLPMLTTIGMGFIGRATRWMPGPTLFAIICLLAVTIAAIGGAYQALALNAGRVGLGNNPIHYGSLAAMVGGLSILGIVSTKSPWRYIFILGPILGVAATVLSGSRGPMASALGMTAVASIYLLISEWKDRVLRFSILTALIIGVGAMLYLMLTSSYRVTALLNAMDIFRFTGGSDDIRAALFSSAAHAFQSSPLYGLGFGQLMVTAQTLYPEFREIHRLENLHADWANFAAMSGGMGLLAWLLLLLAPLSLMFNPSVRADRPTALGAIILVTGQTALGVSNAMFGVLPQTVLYAVALGYLFARALKLPESQQPSFDGGTRTPIHSLTPD